MNPLERVYQTSEQLFWHHLGLKKPKMEREIKEFRKQMQSSTCICCHSKLVPSHPAYHSRIQAPKIKHVDYSFMSQIPFMFGLCKESTGIWNIRLVIICPSISLLQSNSVIICKPTKRHRNIKTTVKQTVSIKLIKRKDDMLLPLCIYAFKFKYKK